jgi:putative ABC transport system ATP-binding protein
VAYTDTPVFAGIDLTIAAGESLVVMGPSGSGKSSLLACVTGMLVPTSGSVQVAGENMSTMSAAHRARLRRKALGLVFQDADLLPELSVAENVALTLLFDGKSRAAALRRAGEALAAVGLDGHGDKKTDQISGGQAQRVALARALVRPSMKLLVADEPTASLDAKNARQVTALLLEHTRRLGAGALVATHDPLVAQACDRVLHLHEDHVELSR